MLESTRHFIIKDEKVVKGFYERLTADHSPGSGLAHPAGKTISNVTCRKGGF